MRTISDFLARKGVASTSFPSSASAKILPSGAEERSEPTFADIGAPVGEDNETLRNLLIDTDRRIGALDDLKEAFRNLVEPIGSSLRARAGEDRKFRLAQCAHRTPRHLRELAQRTRFARKTRGRTGNRGRGPAPGIGLDPADGAWARRGQGGTRQRNRGCACGDRQP